MVAYTYARDVYVFIRFPLFEEKNDKAHSFNNAALNTVKLYNVSCLRFRRLYAKDAYNTKLAEPYFLFYIGKAP